MTALAVIAAACAAAWLMAGRNEWRHRLPVSTGDRPEPARASRSALTSSPVTRLVLCLVAVGVIGWAVGGVFLAVLSVPVAVVLAGWIGRLEPSSQIRARAEVRRDLPLAVELLAACALAGRHPQEVLPVVSAAVGTALGRRLDELAARFALGIDPESVWRSCAADPELGPLGVAMARSARSGAPVADSLTRLAADLRRVRRTESQIRARGVAVRAAGPLAACFLPAFVLIGVVPTVAGSFQQLLG